MKNLWSDVLYQDELIGNSPEIGQLRKSIPSLGKCDEHITIIGETGTEGLVVAKGVFENSPRTKQLLIITKASLLNASLENNILEPIYNTLPSQGAPTDHLVGTIVVQNIESLNLKTQNELLALAQKQYKLNSQGRQPVQTDFRIIATATPNLHEDFKQAGFNSELYLSLTSLTLKIPPLRERKQDIPLFFEFFLKKLCEKNNLTIPSVNFEVFNQLLKHDWQGNVKELENTVRTLVLSSSEGELNPEILPFATETEHFTKLELQNLGLAISRLEKELIEKALRKFAGNQTRAAQVLSISETNLRYKMRKLGISKKEFSFGS